MKVQHCKSRGVLHKNADTDSCISVRSCRSVVATCKRSQDLCTSKRSRGELQLCTGRPEGCQNPILGSSGNTFGAQQRSSTAKSHEVLNKNACSGSSGCIRVRSCFSTTAVAFRECAASGSASAARTMCKIKSPSLRRPFRSMRGSWSFRLCGDLPRDVAVVVVPPVVQCQHLETLWRKAGLCERGRDESLLEAFLATSSPQQSAGSKISPRIDCSQYSSGFLPRGSPFTQHRILS